MDERMNGPSHKELYCIIRESYDSSILAYVQRYVATAVITGDSKMETTCSL